MWWVSWGSSGFRVLGYVVGILGSLGFLGVRLCGGYLGVLRV